MEVSPGLIGWLGVGLVVAVADGYALARKKQTMSDFFAQHYGWAAFIAGGTFTHLILHKRLIHGPR